MEQLPFCSLIDRINDHERASEANFQGDFNGIRPDLTANNGPEHTTVFNILAHLIFKRNMEPTNEPAKQPNSSNVSKFKIAYIIIVFAFDFCSGKLIQLLIVFQPRLIKHKEQGLGVSSGS